MTPQEAVGVLNTLRNFENQTRVTQALSFAIRAIEENKELREALAFAKCTIKSGEPWTETCEEMIGSVLAKHKEGE